MATPPSTSATVSRRVAPPCWTKEETLALVQAYKEKWFALRRRNLKASDWDAVSAVVSSASDPETTKSPVQCRHKIEKLRQRYRAEKQRCLKNPGKFYSSWDLFPLLDSLNFASSSINGSVDQVVGGFYWKLNNLEKIHGNSGSNIGFGHDFSGGYGPNFDFDHKFRDGHAMQGNRDIVTEGIKRFKSNGRIGNDYGSMADFDHSFSRVDSVGEFPLKTFGDKGFMYLDEGMGFQEKASSGFHQKKRGRLDRSFDNGFASCSRSGLGGKNDSGEIKRGIDAVEEIASSIKFLAEGFVRMEKMKVEMVKEIEKTRIEMEMKHSEMVLESQEKIIDAFAKALLKNKKKETTFCIA